MTETVEIETLQQPPKASFFQVRNLIIDLMLVVVLLLGAYYRLTGIYWGNEQYQHPDERFLIWVGADISSTVTEIDPQTGEQVERPLTLGEYFDTENSPLNPHNRGHGFYVYGTLPMTLTRLLVEEVFGKSGWMEMLKLGRPLSAFSDLLTIFLIFLIGSRLYNRRVGLMAAGLLAAAVLPIQLSHFFAFDTFANMLTYLGLYLAVLIATAPVPLAVQVDEFSHSLKTWRFNRYQSRILILSLMFGLVYGAAIASKVSAFPLALSLPIAIGIWLSRQPRENWKSHLYQVLLSLAGAGFLALLCFRIAQPYAFAGPGFFDVRLNPKWLANLKELSVQSAGKVDFPPALQWVDRPRTFAFTNMVLWGMGIPMGVLVWAGFLMMGWRMLRGEWRKHLLIWAWVGPVFIWQSMAFNPMMRYQIPVYPGLALFGAWLLYYLWQILHPDEWLRQWQGRKKLSVILRSGVIVIGALVFLFTNLWAFAFTRIYTRDESRYAASLWILQNVPGAVNLRIQTGESIYNQPLVYPQGYNITPSMPYYMSFSARRSGILEAVSLYRVKDLYGATGQITLHVDVLGVNDEGVLASGEITSDFKDPQSGYVLQFDRAIPVTEGQNLSLSISMTRGDTQVALTGAAPINESSWDMGLPFRVDGYDPYGGIYQDGLNFEMYWDDNPEKLQRFVNTLDQGDFIFISSNRQWGTTTRVPERYPLTTKFYQALLGCPDGEDVLHCYAVAEPGMYQSQLGYDLVAVFESYPNLGTLRINDTLAEEAFTVYDHPKVLIFQKSAAYDGQKVRVILGGVDLTQIVHLSPIEQGKYKGKPPEVILPPDRWKQQQEGGTWSSLFSFDALQNKFPGVGAAMWYVVLTLLGWAIYPMVRLAFPGLPDRGYPLVRAVGLMLLAFLMWWAGSLRVNPSQLVITLLFLGLCLINGWLAIRNRQEIAAEIRTRWKYYLLVETLALTLFVFFLLIRLGNADLWHPYKGGEKPMDFAYFNAVLRSSSYPPYDPWFAGGYLNYYYYGFMIAAVLVKWLGVVPSIAYNFIIPTMFSLLGLVVFSAGWNLAMGVPGLWRKKSVQTIEPDTARLSTPETPESSQPAAVAPEALAWFSGLGAVMITLLFGNLGTVRMIWHGLQKLAAPDGIIDGLSFLERWVYSFEGLFKFLGGSRLPFGVGEWYWVPSRAIPQTVITEFPFFTFLYADLHAHMLAFAITVLVIVWSLSVLLARGRWGNEHGKFRSLSASLGFFFGAMFIGALRPTNTWDFYTYFLFGVIVLGYTTFRYVTPPAVRWLKEWQARLLLTLISVSILAALTFLLYQPFSDWFVQGYNSVKIWMDERTPFWSYLTHWGVFLAALIFWMGWETVDWMANTPVSALRKLHPYRVVIYSCFVVILVVIVALVGIPLGEKILGLGIEIAWLVIPLILWAGILIFRHGQPDAKRLVLFMTGTGLLITLMVEVVYIVGDIGRMNTVFKFYLQAWFLLAISAAAGSGWVLARLQEWKVGWRIAWQVIMAALVFCAALFPVMGGMDKIRDRMAKEAPRTLDGMTFMAYSSYAEPWGTMDLSQDYDAIRWMQQTVQGSPVIVEASQRDLYRWGSRFSIYTGLPAVVGWEWHQQQQKAAFPRELVTNRIVEVENFYRTNNLRYTQEFLQKYNVRYIILGQLERGLYAGAGLEKFRQQDGSLWRMVYADRDTEIYEVIP